MEFERSKADDQRLEKIVKAIAEAKTVSVDVIAVYSSCNLTSPH